MVTENEKILTLHPEGKNGVTISKERYDIMKEAILSSLKEMGEIGWKDLVPIVDSNLGGRFNGSVGWYFTTVKLDLQARNEIRVTTRNGRQFLSLP